MQADRARKLLDAADTAAQVFSDPGREFNRNRETFAVAAVRVLSETVAAVTFEKQPTNKLALAVFYWINSRGGAWRYFFPSDSHILGFGKLDDLLLQVEAHNFPLNQPAPLSTQEPW